MIYPNFRMGVPFPDDVQAILRRLKIKLESDFRSVPIPYTPEEKEQIEEWLPIKQVCVTEEAT